MHLAADDFVQQSLAPAWRRVRESFLEKVGRAGWALDAELPIEQRCLSPSDFGFHNALLTDQGEVIFLDFEYAGWDDPAKTVCDFFCQVDVPAPADAWPSWMRRLAKYVAFTGDELPRRCEMLLPVYQIKWCCILMNVFTATGRARRDFSGAASADPEPLERALRLARLMVERACG